MKKNLLRFKNTAVFAAALCACGMLSPFLSALFASGPYAASMLANVPQTAAWLIDLITHWQWIFLAGLVLFGGLATWLNWRWAFLLCAVPLPWITASPSAPQAGADASGPVFTIASANVLYTNKDATRLARWLQQERPDVVVLLEVSAPYMKRLNALTDYPYRSVQVDDDPFGIAIISRHPLGKAIAVEDADSIPYMRAHIEWQNQRIDLVALHPMPPVSAYYHARRNEILREMAIAARQSGLPRIIAGDLNATPWSASFVTLEDEGLRRASGLSSTWWPAPLGRIVGIPIDHILLTRHWSVVGHEKGPDIGSDHIPIVARMRLTPAP